jgi:diguanylate cyclase (GGDEF)-like protein
MARSVKIENITSMFDVIEIDVDGTEEINQLEGYRRADDQFLDDIINKVVAETDLMASLDIVLDSLERRNYISPRVYRYSQERETCVLMRWLDLPDEFTRQRTEFSVDHPLLSRIVGEIKILHHKNVIDDKKQVFDEDDPMHHIQYGGFIGVPYVGASGTYPKEIKGCIVFNYDPKENGIDERELRILKRLGQIIGLQVTRVLEERIYIKMAQDNLEMAMRDGLTELYNRRKYHQDLGECFELNQREGKNFYLALIDMDYFKKINSDYGHLGGDRILEEMGRAIGMFKKDGIIGFRQGGDEFAMLIETDSADYVRSVLEKLQEEISKYQIPFTATIGAEKIRKEHNDWEKWYHKTDKILDKAKENRGSIIVMN